MTTDDAVRWLLGILAAIIGGGAVTWAGWVSVTLNRLSNKMGGFESGLEANDKTRDKLWQQIVHQLEKLDKRIDRLESYITTGKMPRADA